MAPSLSSLMVGALLLLLQFALAAPWVVLAFLSPEEIDSLRRRPRWVLIRLAIVLGVCLFGPFFTGVFGSDRADTEMAGRSYGALLQLQLTVDLFIFGFIALLALWPKGGAVALAAFREGVRQWMFWLLVLGAVVAMTISIFIPYFTFGEDYLVVKQLGYDAIMLMAVLFGALTASISINEEIEGRTAVTVMSKPVSRRQFLLGKYAGILLAALLMFGILAVYFEGVLVWKHWWEKLTPLSEVAESNAIQEANRVGVVATPAWLNSTLASWNLQAGPTDFLRGLGQWTAHAADTLPGLVLCFSQVMVLVALAVALATRVHMVVNLVTVLVVYFASHLTPVLLSVAGRAREADPTSPVPKLIGFVAQVFDTILPDLSAFRMDSALLSDAPPPAGLFAQYIGSVTLYALVYTVVVLLFGLILFEDKDLA